MKADKRNIGRLLAQADPAIRFYLFHGPDEAGARALAKTLMQSLGAEWVQFEGSNLKSDPAKLADEAGAISMFGGSRLIWIEPAGDEIADAVAALLEAPVVESPALAIAGTLRRNGKLLKLVEPRDDTVAFASYAPEGRALEQALADLAQAKGLRPDPGVIERLAETIGGNRAVAEQELEKFAIFLGATTTNPQSLAHDTLERLGTELAEDRFFALGDAAMAGDLPALETALATLSPGGSEAISAVRALQRRIMQIAPLQARIAQGSRVADVMASQGRPLFWKDKPVVERMLQRWPASRLARLSQRVAELERRLIFGGGGTRVTLAEEMLTIARAGRG